MLDVEDVVAYDSITHWHSMDDDEFAELYGTSAVDEPVQRPSAALVNGATAAHYLPQPAVGRDDFEDLYGQSYVDDAPAAYVTSQVPAPYATAVAAATPFAASAAIQHSSGAGHPLQHQQHTQPLAVSPVAVSKPVAAPADDDDEDFEILVDDDNGPTPAPAAPVAVAYPKPPLPAGAAGAAAAAAGTGLTASGRLSSNHLHYVRPGLEAQGSLGSASLAAGPHGQPHHQHAAPLGPGPEAGAQRQGSVLSGFTGGPLGAAAGQQYSLPLPGGVGHQLPGPPAVPGPRPPAAPYPGPPSDAAAAAGIPGPRPPAGAPPELNFIPMGQAGFQIAAAWRDVDASFPSAAGPQQPIKLPRQHNVDKEEYKEFLNLGHGEIFNLDLDRVTTAPWRAAGADISDFFNYGLTEKSWRQYMRQVAKYRAAYTINNRIEVLSSERTEDDLEGLPREVIAAVRTWRQQHPNKDTPSNNSNNPQQFLPRARGREYKRVADTSVVLSLVTVEEEPQPQAASSRRDKGSVGGEYDGPIAGDIAVSGVPDLPPHTVGPLSPRAAPAELPRAAGPTAVRHLQPTTSGMQHQTRQAEAQQQQYQRQHSSASAGLDGLNGVTLGEDVQRPAAAAAAGMAAAADAHQAGVHAGRGVQVKLAARPPAEEQQQQEQQQHFMDESEMMAEYYNEQLQHQASAGIQQPDWAPDDNDFDFEEGDGFGQLGVSGQQQHLEELDEFDDFATLGQQQPQMDMFMGREASTATMMGMGSFGGGMSLPAADTLRGGAVSQMNVPGGSMTAITRGGSTTAEQGVIGRGQSGVAAADSAGWGDRQGQDVVPRQQQQHLQQQHGRGWDADAIEEPPPQQQQPVFDDGYDGRGGFMGAEGYDGDVGFDSGWGPSGGQGGPMMGEPGGADGWGGGTMPGGGLPPNACFNCGATDHIARNCPHPKHFNITCHNCGEMGHRAKDCQAPKRPPPVSDQRCFKCGQEGHIARDCPNPPRLGPGGGPDRPWGPGPPPPHLRPPQPPPPPRPAGDRQLPPAAAAAAGMKADGDDAARGGPRSGACFKCGQEGHLARECPNPPASPPPEREALQPPTCFKCGGEGHYARECTAGRPGPPRGGEDRWDGGASLDRSGPPPPHRPGPGACYNCGQEGHIARECPAPPRGGPPPPRGPPPLPPPRSVFDRLGGGRGPGPGPGPWDGPPPGRFETPEERAAREAEIDRRLRMAEGVEGGRERDRDASPARGVAGGNVRGVTSRDKERERDRDKDKEVAKRSSRSAAADEGTKSRGREEEERRSSRRCSSRERKRSRSSKSPEHKRDHKKKEKHTSSKRDRSRSLSPSREKESKRSSKHSSRHRSHSKSRSRSRGRHRR